MTAPAKVAPAAPVAQKVDRRLESFAVGCRDLRDSVVDGGIPFIEAVDLAYQAAVWSGLADDLGDDVVQRAMAISFGTIETKAF
jgi:hypothetical protein